MQQQQQQQQQSLAAIARSAPHYHHHHHHHSKTYYSRLCEKKKAEKTKSKKSTLQTKTKTRKNTPRKRYNQPPEPTLFPKLRVRFADFPDLHSSTRLEAAHLGNLLRLCVRRGRILTCCTRLSIFTGQQTRAPDALRRGGSTLPAVGQRD